MKDVVSQINNIVESSNEKKGVWSYLTSIEYMLDSRLYIDSLKMDAEKVASYINGKGKVLDFGTGSGIFAIHLRSLNNNISIRAIDAKEDKSESNPNFHDSRKQQDKIWHKFGKKFNITFSHYDGKNIPFPDESFDVISTYAVLEHVPPGDLDHVVGGLARVLKKGGYLFVFRCPRRYAIAEHLAKFIGAGHHDILYNDDEISKIVEKSGLRRIEKWRSDMIVEFPGRITNKFYRMLKTIDNFLIKTPLNIFAHDVNLVFTKDR